MIGTHSFGDAGFECQELWGAHAFLYLGVLGRYALAVRCGLEREEMLSEVEGWEGGDTLGRSSLRRPRGGLGEVWRRSSSW
jgi:hypothetical protein